MVHISIGIYTYVYASIAVNRRTLCWNLFYHIIALALLFVFVVCMHKHKHVSYLRSCVLLIYTYSLYVYDNQLVGSQITLRPLKLSNRVARIYWKLFQIQIKDIFANSCLCGYSDKATESMPLIKPKCQHSVSGRPITIDLCDREWHKTYWLDIQLVGGDHILYSFLDFSLPVSPMCLDA